MKIICDCGEELVKLDLAPVGGSITRSVGIWVTPYVPHMGESDILLSIVCKCGREAIRVDAPKPALHS